MGIFNKKKSKDDKVIDFKEAIKERNTENKKPDVESSDNNNSLNLNKSNNENVSDKENYIKYYDKFGREVHVKREEWRTKVLPDQIQKNWNNADYLYGNIINALSAGFEADIIDAAKRLFEIDTIAERGYTILSIVYLQNNMLKEAQDTLEKYIDKYGETGIIVTNLAKVYYAENDEEKGYATLKRAVKLDPNQDNALNWFSAINLQKGGKQQLIKVLKDAADVDGSWRPQMLLAEEYLKEKDIEKAEPLLKYVIDTANNIPDVLASISGSLGQNGYIDKIFELVCPVYSVEKHGPMPGLNILLAYLKAKNLEKGEALLDSLFKLNNPEIKERLLFYSNEFDKLKNEKFMSEKSDIANNQVKVLAFAKPIWYLGLNDPQWLLKDKSSGIKVGFFNLTYSITKDEAAPKLEQEDDLGRLTRSIPLYLSEELFLDTDMRCVSILPTIEGTGWLVSRSSWPDNIITGYLGEDEGRFDYIISGEVKDEGGNYKLMLEIWEKNANTIIKTIWESAPKDEIGNVVWKLMNQLKDYFKENGAETKDSVFDIKEDDVTEYLVQLGQAASLSCAQCGYMPKEALWGERNIFENFLNMALNTTYCDVPKIMLLSGMCKAFSYGSDFYAEYGNKMFNIINDEKDKSSVLYKLLPIFLKIFGKDEQFEQLKTEYLQNCDDDYAKWINSL